MSVNYILNSPGCSIENDLQRSKIGRLLSNRIGLGSGWVITVAPQPGDLYKFQI